MTRRTTKKKAELGHMLMVLPDMLKDPTMRSYLEATLLNDARQTLGQGVLFEIRLGQPSEPPYQRFSPLGWVHEPAMDKLEGDGDPRVFHREPKWMPKLGYFLLRRGRT